MSATPKKDPGLSKERRHKAIRELLLRKAVANQEELRRELAEAGIHAAQATLSRDIHQLRLSKNSSGYKLPDTATVDADDSQPALGDTLRSFGIGVRQAQNLLVVLTTNGGAHPVAAGIDRAGWDGVAGTIAGDDTVLVICTDNQQAGQVRMWIEACLP